MTSRWCDSKAPLVNTFMSCYDRYGKATGTSDLATAVIWHGFFNMTHWKARLSETLPVAFYYSCARSRFERLREEGWWWRITKTEMAFPSIYTSFFLIYLNENADSYADHNLMLTHMQTIIRMQALLESLHPETYVKLQRKLKLDYVNFQTFFPENLHLTHSDLCRTFRVLFLAANAAVGDASLKLYNTNISNDYKNSYLNVSKTNCCMAHISIISISANIFQWKKILL